LKATIPLATGVDTDTTPFKNPQQAQIANWEQTPIRNPMIPYNSFLRHPSHQIHSRKRHIRGLSLAFSIPVSLCHSLSLTLTLSRSRLLCSVVCHYQFSTLNSYTTKSRASCPQKTDDGFSLPRSFSISVSHSDSLSRSFVHKRQCVLSRVESIIDRR